MEFSVYGSFNWSFHYSKTPEAELLDSGVLNNVSYENIGVVELDNKNVFAVFHIDPFDDESAGVLIAHMKKSGNMYQYLGYYHFFYTGNRYRWDNGLRKLYERAENKRHCL